MDHPDFVVCSFMENFIGPKKIKLILMKRLEAFERLGSDRQQ